MSQAHAEASAIVNAPPSVVYATLADYRTGHPQALPKPTFSDLTIEQGGQGAGTVFRVTVTVLGTATKYHMRVAEPQPGRVLAETDLTTGLTTTFTVDPIDGGQRSRVTIATDWTSRGGLAGYGERLLTPFFMQRIYAQQLRQLDEVIGQGGRA
ncbi:MAG: SRPBCC family protein [Anaerolineae bacterium]|jgi:carbon monoxide dehydrogenase subunit G|nr:SRPBCC family protein [Anaerolineae bacterium]